MNKFELNRELISPLTSIRFFAALVVVLSHFTQLELISFPSSILDFFDHGRSAVSLFFVLSGFVLTYTYGADYFSVHGVRSFYVARVARIYPVVIIGLLLAFIVTLHMVAIDSEELFLSWYALKDKFGLSLAASFFAQIFLLTAWFPFAAINQPWNGPMWSVSCEAFFYILFPWLVSFGRKRNIYVFGFVCFVFWIVQGLFIELIFNNFPVNRRGFIISQFPLTHLFEFVVGIYAALVYECCVDVIGRKFNLGLIFILCSMATLAFLGLYQPFRPSYYFQSPLFAVLILGLALLDRPVLGFLDKKFVVLLGSASFSLYVIHVPLAHIFQIFNLGDKYGFLLLILTIFTSVCVYLFIEEPCRKFIKRRLDKPVY